MRRTIILQDIFRHHYRLHSSDDVPVCLAIEPKHFWDPVLTEQFVRHLRVPVGFWQPILLRYAAGVFDPNVTSPARISQLLIRGTLKFYPVKHLDKRPGSRTNKPSYPTIEAEKGQSYQLVPASVLLEKPNATTKMFANKAETSSFVASLDLDNEQITAMFATMDAPTREGKPAQTKQRDTLTQALLDRKVVVLIQQQGASPPPKDAEVVSAQRAGDQSASLGPHEEGAGTEIVSTSDDSTAREVELAKTTGTSPEQVEARVKVAKAFYQSEPSLGERRFIQEIKGINLYEPVEVVEFPPPETMQQYVREPHQNPGNFFDPVGGQSADSLGVSDEGRVLKTFKTPKGKGLISTSAPVKDDWTNLENSVMCKGGGKQIVVGSYTKQKFKPV